jgi:hypothetical protein
MRTLKPVLRTSLLVALGLVLSACRGATREASTPHGKTQTTAAQLPSHVERMLVADRGEVALVSRGGCIATVRSVEGAAGSSDELHVRCPKPEQLEKWFDAADQAIARVRLVPTPREAQNEDEEVDSAVPSAKILTANGQTMKVVESADAKKLAGDVHALTVTLASAENVAPGPATANGWQMLHVRGPAHVVFAGAPAHGVLEARMSTNGQYMCEFFANVGGQNPLHATKSGWLTPTTAAHAIDEVLVPFDAGDEREKSLTKGGFVGATTAGAEKRSNPSSTAAVFERFAQVQDALGDACLPELEAEPPAQVSL